MRLAWMGRAGASVIVGVLVASGCGADRDEAATPSPVAPEATEASGAGSDRDSRGDGSAPDGSEASQTPERDPAAGEGDAGDPAAGESAAAGEDGAGDPAAGESAAAEESTAEGAAEETAPETPESEPEAPAVPMYGDLPWPCGPGDAAGATDRGVFDDRIVIGAGDDRGFTGSPGLSKPQTDALEAFVAHCNSLGGINGRSVEVVVYDAAVFEVSARMAAACDQVFMLVGQGFALDGLGEEIRQGCGVASVPAWSVSADFGHAPLMYQSVPNPSDQQAMSQAYQVAALHPDRIADSAVMFANFGATIETKDKVLASWPQAGYEFDLAIEFNVFGEEDWTPFVLQLKDAGIDHVYFTGNCLPHYQQLREAAVVNGYDAVWTVEANFYDAACIAANSNGAMDRTYVRLAHLPLEEAGSVPALQQFLSILDAAGVEPTLLGLQSTSSFLLWAAAAGACGRELTTRCVLDNIAALEDWTAGGVQVPAVPRDNNAPVCGLLMEFDGLDYRRVAPAEPATFECDDSWRATVETAAVAAAALDGDRVSRLYSG